MKEQTWIVILADGSERIATESYLVASIAEHGLAGVTAIKKSE
ncbi:MAG: hypothetical protein QOE26_2779 [Verrucomicrobiota bacterium]|jgi:hypothetical protein